MMLEGLACITAASLIVGGVAGLIGLVYAHDWRDAAWAALLAGGAVWVLAACAVAFMLLVAGCLAVLAP